jgi:hypothetical protein
VEAVAAKVLKVGWGALMAKLDIRQAYRNTPVHPLDRPLLGMLCYSQTAMYAVGYLAKTKTVYQATGIMPAVAFYKDRSASICLAELDRADCRSGSIGKVTY